MTAATRLLRPLAILALGVVTVAAGAFGGTARAADNLGYQISPPVTYLTMDPGTSTKATIKVTNLTDQQITLAVTKQNFVAKGEEGEVELTDAADPTYSLAPYFTLSQNLVDVPPRSTKDVTYSLDVPANAEPGGRYGSINFNTIPAKLPSGQSGAAVKQELAALVFLRINGAANEQLKIDSFKTDKSFYEYSPVNFTARVQNLGTVHEKPTGDIVVKNIFGFKIANVKLDEKYIIPGATRQLTATLNKKFLFGPYTAILSLHNGSQQLLTAKTSFTVIPYKPLIIVIIILALLVFFFWKTRKRWARAFKILAGKE